MTVRNIGGGFIREDLRIVDFKEISLGVPAVVKLFEI